MLADRGFDIADSVGAMQTMLHKPAFTKGKSQLSALDVEDTRTIANIRIHVERVIGFSRQRFSILQSTLPIHFLSDPLLGCFTFAFPRCFTLAFPFQKLRQNLTIRTVPLSSRKILYFETSVEPFNFIVRVVTSNHGAFFWAMAVTVGHGSNSRPWQ